MPKKAVPILIGGYSRILSKTSKCIRTGGKMGIASEARNQTIYILYAQRSCGIWGRMLGATDHACEAHLQGLVRTPMGRRLGNSIEWLTNFFVRKSITITAWVTSPVPQQCSQSLHLALHITFLVLIMNNCKCCFFHWRVKHGIWQPGRAH